MVDVQAVAGHFFINGGGNMAYIYCIRHDNIGYIGKDSHSVSSLDRILAHVTNAFTKNSSDSAAYTINKWGYSGNV